MNSSCLSKTVISTYLEESRLREVMDTPTIQVLDPAVAPGKRTWPRRSLIALFGFVLGAGIGVVRSRSSHLPAPLRG